MICCLNASRYWAINKIHQYFEKQNTLIFLPDYSRFQAALATVGGAIKINKAYIFLKSQLSYKYFVGKDYAMYCIFLWNSGFIAKHKIGIQYIPLKIINVIYLNIIILDIFKSHKFWILKCHVVSILSVTNHVAY